MKQKFIYIFFILTIFFQIVSAYNSNDLISYYDYDNTFNRTTMGIDSQNRNNLTVETNINVQVSWFPHNYAIYLNNTGGLHQAYTTNFTDLVNSDWSVNTWFKYSGSTGTSKVFEFGNSTGPTYWNVFLNGCLGATRLSLVFDDSSLCSHIVVNGTTTTATNTWYMVTVTKSSNTYSLYVNGNLEGTYTNSTSTHTKNFRLGPASFFTIEDTSVWNTSLTASDLNVLYNSGNGLTYTQTTDNSGSVSSTLYYYDICIPTNILCHNLTVDGTNANCPITINSQLNQEHCIASCIDNQTYYDNLGIPAPSYNYSGSCGLCSNQCTTENTTVCSNDTLSTCRLSYNGCYQLIPTFTCSYGCSNGLCNPIPPPDQNPSSELGHATTTTTSIWCPFFNIDCTSSDTNKLLVAIIVTIITLCLGLGIIFAIISYTHTTLPPFITFGILALTIFLPLIYFLAIGFIPFWILIITIGIIALAGASWYTAMIFNKRR